MTLKFRAFIAFITAKSKSSNQFANSKSPIFSIRFSKHLFIQTSNPKFYSVSDSSASLSLSTHQDQSPSLSPSSFVPPISGTFSFLSLSYVIVWIIGLLQYFESSDCIRIELVSAKGLDFICLFLLMMGFILWTFWLYQNLIFATGFCFVNLLIIQNLIFSKGSVLLHWFMCFSRLIYYFWSLKFG